jgi:hypothetical protein
MRAAARFVVDTHGHITTPYKPATGEADRDWDGLSGEVNDQRDQPDPGRQGGASLGPAGAARAAVRERPPGRVGSAFQRNRSIRKLAK